MHAKRFNIFFKRWFQFRVGAIPHLPDYTYIESNVFYDYYYVFTFQELVN